MISGEYNPAFGIMKIEADCSNLSAHDFDVLSACLHEEIHYLENFITLYGINRSIEIMSVLIKAIEDARCGTYSTMKISDDEDFVLTCYELMKGSNADIKCHTIESIELKNYLKDYYVDKYADYITDEFDTVELIFHDGNEKYLLGGEAISESVAYLFEKYMYNSNDYSKYFPYNACEMVYEYFWQSECKNIEALLFLSFVSLMNRFPGVAFVKYMKQLRENGIFSLDNVIKIAYANVHFANDRLFAELEKRIDILFPLVFDEVEEHKLFKEHKDKIINMNKWLKGLYKTSIKMQDEFLKTIYAFLETNDKEFGKKCITELIYNIFGKPVIYDINGKVYDDNDKRLVLFAPETLYHILVEKKSDCKFYPICQNYNPQSKAICEIDCSKYITENSICILRYYLYMMGLGDLNIDRLCC